MHDVPIIPILMMLPLIGGVALLFVPRDRPAVAGHVTLITSSIVFVLTVVMGWQFDWSNTAAGQYGYAAQWIGGFGASVSGQVDSISLWFILLTAFLVPIMVLESYTNLGARTRGRTREYFFWLLAAEAALFGAFTATDLLYFYVCFEFTLIPLFFLIGIFGSDNRLKAAGVFFLYSFAGSMLMLAGILYLAYYNASLDPTDTFAIGESLQANALFGQWTFDAAALTVAGNLMPGASQAWVLVALMCGLAVKVPMWPVHTWLPLAHTEAPTAGSVKLAAVLLKLGTYGILRFVLPVLPVAVIDLGPWIAGLAVVGVVYAALVCWVQKDIKKLIAYSSVSHMGFCILGLFALNVIGVGGSVFYMIAHGISTGALFLCVGMIYERYHTRKFADYSGLGRVIPVWGFFFVFFCLASVGLPGLNGFVGEFLTLMGAFVAGPLGWPFALAAGTGLILGAIYILYMVGLTVFGPVKVPDTHDEHHGDAHATPQDLNLREIGLLTPLAVVCLVTGLYPSVMLDSFKAPAEQLTAAANAEYESRLNVQVVEAEDAQLQLELVLDDTTDTPNPTRETVTP